MSQGQAITDHVSNEPPRELSITNAAVHLNREDQYIIESASKKTTIIHCIEKAAKEYLEWMRENVVSDQEGKAVSRRVGFFTHVYHDLDGYNQVKNLLALIENNTDSKEILESVISCSLKCGNAQHSFSRYLFKSMYPKDAAIMHDKNSFSRECFEVMHDALNEELRGQLNSIKKKG